MSATTPGLLEPGIDADATARRIHPFFAPEPRWRISKSTDRSKIALLRLPAEVRLLIYDHVMIIDFAIDKIMVKRRNNTAARHPQWRSRAQIADAFSFMQTCRAVYNEAQQIFWGKNFFIIHASPPFGVWPRPDVRDDDLWTQFDLTNNCKWKITLAVESAQSQKMICRLLWVFPEDPWYSLFGQWRERSSAAVKFNGSDIVSSNLTNVQELCVFLNEDLSHKASYPTLDEVPGLIEQGILSQKVIPRLNSGSNQARIRDAEVFTNATVNSIQYLTGQVFQRTQKVSFVGEAHLSTLYDFWYRLPLKPLPPDCLYLKRLRQAFEYEPLEIEWAYVFYYCGRCVYCMGEWNEEHWSSQNDLQICPGLGYVEAD